MALLSSLSLALLKDKKPGAPKGPNSSNHNASAAGKKTGSGEFVATALPLSASGSSASSSLSIPQYKGSQPLPQTASVAQSSLANGRSALQTTAPQTVPARLGPLLGSDAYGDDDDEDEPTEPSAKKEEPAAKTAERDESPSRNIGNLLGYSDSDEEGEEAKSKQQEEPQEPPGKTKTESTNSVATAGSTASDVASKKAHKGGSSPSSLPSGRRAPSDVPKMIATTPLDNDGEELTREELAPIAHMCGPSGWRWQVTAAPEARGRRLGERRLPSGRVEDDPDFEDFTFLASMEASTSSSSAADAAVASKNKALPQADAKKERQKQQEQIVADRQESESPSLAAAAVMAADGPAALASSKDDSHTPEGSTFEAAEAAAVAAAEEEEEAAATASPAAAATASAAASTSTGGAEGADAAPLAAETPSRVAPPRTAQRQTRKREEAWLSSCLAREEQSKRAKTITFKAPAVLLASRTARSEPGVEASSADDVVSSDVAATASSGDVAPASASAADAPPEARQAKSASDSKAAPSAEDERPAAQVGEKNDKDETDKENAPLLDGRVAENPGDASSKPPVKAESSGPHWGWLQEGQLCTLCGKKVPQRGGVICGRQRPAGGSQVGCGARICWKCMNTAPKESFGDVRTRKSEFTSLGDAAWWMHEACMEPEDSEAYYAVDDDEEPDEPPTKKAKTDASETRREEEKRKEKEKAEDKEEDEEEKEKNEEEEEEVTRFAWE